MTGGAAGWLNACLCLDSAHICLPASSLSLGQPIRFHTEMEAMEATIAALEVRLASMEQHGLTIKAMPTPANPGEPQNSLRHCVLVLCGAACA